MSEGTPLRALLWGLATALTLLAWPWLLAWLQARRPRLMAGTGAPALAEMTAGLGRHARPRAPLLLPWTALAVAAALLPVGNGWLAASLDAGLLWLMMLATVAAVRLAMSAPRTATAAAGALATFLLCLAPLVVRTASLHLQDLVLAQQGGAGNWFLVRDPFLLAAGSVCLLAIAALWPAADMAGLGADGPVTASVRLGLPLVMAHLFTVAFLGGWWAVVPALDGASWLNTILKNLLVLALLAGLRRRRPAWCDAGLLAWRLPLAALVSCLGALAWLLFSGAVL